MFVAVLGFCFSKRGSFGTNFRFVHARFVVVPYLTDFVLFILYWPNHYLFTYHVVSSPKSIEPAFLLFPFISCVKDTNFEERV